VPISADDLQKNTLLRMLCMGIPKKGRTTHLIMSAPSPIRVLLCEDDSALEGADRERLGIGIWENPPKGVKFDFERVRGWNDMAKFTIEAKKDAKEGRIKTVLVGPFNFWCDRLMEECYQQTLTKDGKEDGRRAHPEFFRRMRHAVELLATIPAHFILESHHMEMGGGDESANDEKKAKTGPGIVPLLPNMASRTWLHGFMHDVVWFDVAPKDYPDAYQKRIFITGSDDIGPGCRSFPGNYMLPANVTEFLNRKKNGKPNRPKPNGAPAPKAQPPKPNFPKGGVRV